MLRLLALLLLMLLPLTAVAEPPPRSPAAEGLELALRQVNVAVAVYSEALAAVLAKKDAEIAEVKKKCGEPCAEAK